MEIFFPQVFPENKIWHRMKCQILFSEKKKKKKNENIVRWILYPAC